MSRDTKWKVVIYGMSICILSLCFVAVRLCNSGHQGWALSLVAVLLVASFFNIYLMCKREDMLGEQITGLPCVVNNIEGNNLPCVVESNPVHCEIMNTLEIIVRN